MNKSAYVFLFLSVIFFSCSKENSSNSTPSTGKINSVSVVIDDILWNGVVGDSIRNKFASPVEGLPKEEPQFDINQFSIRVMEGFETKSRMIIVFKIGTKNSFVIIKNQHATPQNVVHITGKSLSDLIQLIEKKSPQVIQIIQEGELKAHQLMLNDSLMPSNALQKQFQLTLKIPNNYKYIIKKEDFVWLKNEFVSGSLSLIITELPSDCIDIKGDFQKQFIKIHDSIGALYIKSKKSASSMYIDESFPLYVSKIMLNGKVTYEVKGTWRLKDSFMFGSFLNYFVLDPQNNRIVFLEGFCYVPSKDKRDFMHELESILKRVQIN
ncbi:Protein of unknown function DUF4837 [Flavobacteriaceae bacterium]